MIKTPQKNYQKLEEVFTVLLFFQNNRTNPSPENPVNNQIKFCHCHEFNKPLNNCHFGHSKKSTLLIHKDSSLRPE
jgi:hypothetical protein